MPSSLRKAAEILNSVNEGKKKASRAADQDRRNMIFSVGQDIVAALKPVLNQIAAQSRLTRADMSNMVSNIKVTTNTPTVNIPPINVPKAEVTVRQPNINIPDVIMPSEMNVRGWVQLQGVNLDNPLPV